MIPDSSAVYEGYPDVEVCFYTDFMGRRLGKSVVGNPAAGWVQSRRQYPRVIIQEIKVKS